MKKEEATNMWAEKQKSMMMEFLHEIDEGVLYPEEYANKREEALLRMIRSGDYVLVEKSFYENYVLNVGREMA